MYYISIGSGHRQIIKIKWLGRRSKKNLIGTSQINIFAFFLHLREWCQVKFFSTRTTHVTPRSDTNTNNGGRREMCVFLAGNTVIILSLCQLKMRLLRFVVHTVLATMYYQASKTQPQVWRNIWSHSTVKFTEQVPSGGVKQRVASKSNPILQEVPHHPNNKSWTSVQNK